MLGRHLKFINSFQTVWKEIIFLSVTINLILFCNLQNLRLLIKRNSREILKYAKHNSYRTMLCNIDTQSYLNNLCHR